MNIFFLDRDVVTCAKYHCDKHVVKMIVETAQLLSTAVRLNGFDNDDVYKITHKNHPSAVWVRSSSTHYIWTLDLLRELLTEYTIRYGKIHKTTSVYQTLINIGPIGRCIDWIDPPQCMPDDCKSSDTVESYRAYYKAHKSHFATWKTCVPSWW